MVVLGPSRAPAHRPQQAPGAAYVARRAGGRRAAGHRPPLGGHKRRVLRDAGGRSRAAGGAVNRARAAISLSRGITAAAVMDGGRTGRRPGRCSCSVRRSAAPDGWNVSLPWVRDRASGRCLLVLVAVGRVRRRPLAGRRLVIGAWRWAAPWCWAAGSTAWLLQPALGHPGAGTCCRCSCSCPSPAARRSSGCGPSRARTRSSSAWPAVRAAVHGVSGSTPGGTPSAPWAPSRS